MGQIQYVKFNMKTFQHQDTVILELEYNPLSDHDIQDQQ